MRVEAIGTEATAMPDSEADVQAEEIRVLVLMVMKAAMRDLDRRLEASGTGISGLQYGVMRQLNHESATISELSGRMLVAPATLVPVVDALERKGFVQRSSDPKDRRRVPLILTADGMQTIVRVPAASGLDPLTQGLASLGREKSRQFQALFYELVNSVIGDDVVVDRKLVLAFNGPPKSAS